MRERWLPGTGQKGTEHEAICNVSSGLWFTHLASCHSGRVGETGSG